VLVERGRFGEFGVYHDGSNPLARICRIRRHDVRLVPCLLIYCLDSGTIPTVTRRFLSFPS
jgi:hypothetical protein